ncbi:MAG: arginase family protein [Candidatus Limnocylindria bacterium]
MSPADGGADQSPRQWHPWLLTSRELQSILRGLRGLNVVGCDVVEVSPQYDHAEITAVVAANVVYEMLTLFIRRE